jgi:Carboxypeptidase regulatory-like domain
MGPDLSFFEVTPNSGRSRRCKCNELSPVYDSPLQNITHRDGSRGRVEFFFIYMTHRKSSSAFPRFTALALLILGLVGGVDLPAQSPTGSVQGVVTDPSGARVPKATVTITGVDGTSATAQSGPDGRYAFSKVVPGTYNIGVASQGFSQAQPGAVKVEAGRAVQLDLSLAIAEEQQQVTVSDQGTTLDTSPDNNASAVVIKGKDLDALSDDPDELQDELNALAGPAAGPNGGQIYIDGFTGGQLPPKSSIREIRINQNPFSAEYDKLGYGRIEILTKPGTDKLRGMVLLSGNDSAFNSLNTFVTSEPPYYSTFLVGNAGGPCHEEFFVVLECLPA